MIPALLNHLWQSTLFALGAGLLTLTLRKNGAGVRYGLWFAASVKFLIPFAVLAWAGGQVLARLHPVAPALLHLEMIRQVVAPLTPAPGAAVQIAPAVTQTARQAAPLNPLPILLAVWSVGFAAVLATWALRWARIRAALRAASPLAITAPVPVLSSSSLLEPGLVGIWRPVMVLPDGIAERLSPAEMDAVIAHELSHLRRHDNLTAAIHMLVEALVWFHPLVWWLGARLIAERERACDEAVVRAGNDPRTYAEGILKVCRLYLRQPLACAAGVSGANLKTRIETIMTNPISVRLGPAKTLLLASAATLSLAVPLAAGLFASAPAVAQIAKSIDVLPKPIRQKQVRRTLQAIQAIETAPAVQQAPKPGILTLAVIQNVLSPVPEIDPGATAAVSLSRQAPDDLSAISTASSAQPILAAAIDYPRFGGVALRGMSIGPEEGLCRREAIAPATRRAGALPPGVWTTLQRFVADTTTGKADYEMMSPAMATAVRKGPPVGIPDPQRLARASAAHLVGVDHAGNDVYGVDQKGGLTHWNIALNRQGLIEAAFICDGGTAPVRVDNVARLRFGGVRGGSRTFNFPCPDVTLMDARAKEGRSPPAQTDALIRRFVQDTIASDRPDYDDMSPAMASAVRKILPNAWPDLITRFRGVTASRRLGRDDLGNDLYIVHITGRDSYSLVGVDGAGKVDAALFCSAG